MITLNWTGTVIREDAFENEEHYKTGTWLKDGVEQGVIEILLQDGEQITSDTIIIESLDRPWLT